MAAAADDDASSIYFFALRILFISLLILDHISEIDVVPSFDAMGLKKDLLRGIYAYGFLSICASYDFKKTYTI